MDEDLQNLVDTTTRGGLILLLGQVSSTLLLAVGMLLVARFLGPSNYGSYNKAQSVVQIAFLIVNLGINSSMIKYIAQYRYEKKYDHIKTLIEAGGILTLLISISTTIVVYITSGFISNNIYKDPSQEILIKYFSISIIGQALVNFANGITVGYENMASKSIVQLCYSFTKSVVSPVLVYLGLGILGAVIGHSAPVLISGAVGSIFVISIYSKLKHEPSQFSHIHAMKQILTYGFPIYLSFLLNGILPQIYTTLLGIWETDGKIGNYGVATNFTVLVTFITTPIMTSIFPLFSKFTYKQPELEFFYKNAVKYSTLLAYPIFWTVMALADPIIEALFDGSYRFAPSFLRYYLLLFIFIGFGSICNSQLINSQKRTDLTFKSTIIRFSVSIPLALYFIQHYGVNGLIFTSFIGMAVNSLIDYYNVRRIFKYNINYNFLLKILSISIVSYIVVYQVTRILNQNPWVELFFGGLLSLTIYIIGIVYSRALTINDLRYLENITNKFGPLSPLIKLVIQIMIKLQ